MTTSSIWGELWRAAINTSAAIWKALYLIQNHTDIWCKKILRMDNSIPVKKIYHQIVNNTGLDRTRSFILFITPKARLMFTSLNAKQGPRLANELLCATWESNCPNEMEQALHKDAHKLQSCERICSFQHEQSTTMVVGSKMQIQALNVYS